MKYALTLILTAFIATNLSAKTNNEIIRERNKAIMKQEADQIDTALLINSIHKSKEQNKEKQKNNKKNKKNSRIPKGH